MRLYKISNQSGLHWGIDYTDPRTKKRVRKIVGRSKKEAETVLERIRQQLFEQKYDNLPKRKGSAAWMDVLSRYREYSHKVHRPETFKRDMIRIKRFNIFLADRNITKIQLITPGLLQEFQALYLKEHSKTSWNKILMLIKAILNRAIEWDIIDYNPINKLKSIRTDKSFHYFTKDELELLIDSAAEPLKSAIILLSQTGMRRGELFSLRWRDVNLKDKKITIKPYDGFSTKSGKLRSIPISDKLNEMLLKKKRASGDGYVCRPYPRENTLTDQFLLLCRKLGIKGRLHDLRHTFASHLAMAGVPIPAIKELLGHSDITTTMIYAHLSPEAHREAISRLPY